MQERRSGYIYRRKRELLSLELSPAKLGEVEHLDGGEANAVLCDRVVLHEYISIGLTWY